MDKEYLKESQYDWENDPRHLKVNTYGIMRLPEGRCVHCARIFLNAEINIAYCKLCDCAMSMNPLGPEHDFDTWGNKIKIKDPASTKEEKKTFTIILTARRHIRTPIDFDEESKYFNRNKKEAVVDEPHFTTAAGKIIPIDADSDLYKMGLEK